MTTPQPTNPQPTHARIMTLQRILRTRVRRDDRGATLILALGMLIVFAALAASLLPLITSGLQDRGVLDRVRDRQYAADAAIETAIVQVKSDFQTGTLTGTPPTNPCPASPTTYTLNNVAIKVACSYVPGVVLENNGGTLVEVVQRNVVFDTSCTSAAPICTNTASIVRAQVNFQGTGTTVTKTWIQSWSVNQ